jgi:hypothetical protein
MQFLNLILALTLLLLFAVFVLPYLSFLGEILVMFLVTTLVFWWLGLISIKKTKN